jgi:hypothetical protein
MEQGNSPREVEAAHATCAGRPLSLDPVDARHARPFLERSLQLLELVAAALRDELDRPVVVVANPPLETELLRFALHEVTEPDSLHIAVNHGVQPLHV